jgi:predicted alpha/beta-hydrolase family hydrolase
MAERLDVEVGALGRTSALAYRSTESGRAHPTLVLAHGAGAPQQSGFMTQFASGLASRGVNVLTFNFLYTEQRRRIPDRTAALEACFRAAIAVARSYPPFEAHSVFIGGKSMGGRIATHLAAASGEGAAGHDISGVVVLGYPLHPPGKPEQLRTAHLPGIRVPMLIVQGAKDPFGTPAELKPVLEALSSPATLHVVEGADHSLAPPKRTGSVDRVHGEVQDVIAQWMTHRSAPSHL